METLSLTMPADDGAPRPRSARRRVRAAGKLPA